MRKPIPVGLALCALAACGGQPEETFTYNTNAGKDSSIAIEVIPDTLKSPEYVFPDTMVLHISARKIAWEGKAVNLADLQSEVQDSLLSIYLHTGRLPGTLAVQYSGTVAKGVRVLTGNKISQAREVVRNVVSVAKYRLPFGRLEEQEQDSLQKNYPILFDVPD